MYLKKGSQIQGHKMEGQDKNCTLYPLTLYISWPNSREPHTAEEVENLELFFFFSFLLGSSGFAT